MKNIDVYTVFETSCLFAEGLKRDIALFWFRTGVQVAEANIQNNLHKHSEENAKLRQDLCELRLSLASAKMQLDAKQRQAFDLFSTGFINEDQFYEITKD